MTRFPWNDEIFFGNHRTVSIIFSRISFVKICIFYRTIPDFLIYQIFQLKDPLFFLTIYHMKIKLILTKMEIYLFPSILAYENLHISS